MRSSWGHDSVHAEAAPPVKAMFIEPRLICQSTFLLLRDRRSGGLSDCPSGVITFTTTHCSAAPQTPGKLPQLLTFPLEKIHVEMAATVWHTFYLWGKSEQNPSLCLFDHLHVGPGPLTLYPTTPLPRTEEATASIMWIYDAPHERVCDGLPRAEPLWV